jgi:hypothetical protein
METAILENIKQLPDDIKKSVFLYTEFLVSQLSNKSLEKVEIQPPKKRNLFGSMKGTFVLPLPDDFNDPIEDFEQSEEKYGYGSLAGKITMSEDFDAPLEDFAEYM